MKAQIKIVLFLFLISGLYAQEIDISFEVFSTKSSNQKLLEEKMIQLQNQSFECYEVPKDVVISIYCNDSHTTDAMQANIKRLKDNNIIFKIIQKKSFINKKEDKQLKQTQENKVLRHTTFLKDYQVASELTNNKKFLASNRMLLPYIQHNTKAKNLYLSNILALSHREYENGNDKKALNLLKPHRKESVKIKKYYEEILYKHKYNTALHFLPQRPELALVFFKEACRLKSQYSCAKGMVKSYYRMKEYRNAIALGTKIEASSSDEEVKKIIKDSKLELRKKPIHSSLKKKELVYQKKHSNYKKKKKMTRTMQHKLQYKFALYEFHDTNYGKCINLLDKIAVSTKADTDLYNRCYAYYSIQQRDLEKAKNYIMKVDDKDIQASFFIDLAEAYHNVNTIKSKHYLHIAKQLNRASPEKALKILRKKDLMEVVDPVVNREIYLYALKTYNNGNNADALRILDTINKVKDKNQAIEIASLYIKLKKYKRAKRILLETIK